MSDSALSFVRSSRAQSDLSLHVATTANSNSVSTMFNVSYNRLPTFIDRGQLNPNRGARHMDNAREAGFFRTLSGSIVKKVRHLSLSAVCANPIG